MPKTDAAACSAEHEVQRQAGTRGAFGSVERLARVLGPSLEWVVHRPDRPTTGAAPVLFLHGACSGAWCWRESWLQTVAETGRHAAAVSLRGHGGSDGQAEVWRSGLADFSADLKLAVESMPAPPVLVAHSVGGLLAQHMLGQIPARAAALRGLVLVGSLPPEGLAWIGPWLGWSHWGSAAGWAGAPWPMSAACLSAFADPDAMFGAGVGAGAAAAYAARMGKGALLGLAQALLPQLVAPACIVGIPTLVLHGSSDRLVDPVTAWRTAIYHGAAFAPVAGAGHFLMLGPHAGAGAEALSRWLVEQAL